MEFCISDSLLCLPGSEIRLALYSVLLLLLAPEEIWQSIVI